MVVGRVRRGAVTEVVSPEQYVPRDAKAETGRTGESSTVYPLPDDARERLDGMGLSEVQKQSWGDLDDAWAWISGGEPRERGLEDLAAVWGNGERPVADEPEPAKGQRRRPPDVVVVHPPRGRRERLGP